MDCLEFLVGLGQAAWFLDFCYSLIGCYFMV